MLINQGELGENSPSIEGMERFIPPVYPKPPLKERLGLKLLEIVPGGGPFGKLRKMLYPAIFAKVGNFVDIQRGAEFVGASNIELRDHAHIFRNTSIDAKGENNKVIIGSAVLLNRGVDITGLDNTTIEIGDHTFLNSHCSLVGPGHIKIGCNCLFGPRVALIAVNHQFTELTKPIRLQGHTAKGITIEDDCWLGYGVVVVDGVTIGRGSVIGAGAVVTKDIPPFSIAVGVPAKIVGSRNS